MSSHRLVGGADDLRLRWADHAASATITLQEVTAGLARVGAIYLTLSGRLPEGRRAARGPGAVIRAEARNLPKTGWGSRQI
jgi:hypothetical protein